MSRKYFRNAEISEGKIVVYPWDSTDAPVFEAASEEEYAVKLAVANIDDSEVERLSLDDCLRRSMEINPWLTPTLFIVPGRMQKPVSFEDSVKAAF